MDTTNPRMASKAKYGKILFIDAYDSFSENIAALLSEVLRVQVTMIHIDTSVEELLEEPVRPPGSAIAHFLQQFDAVVLGPGPGNPEIGCDVGLFSEIWKLSNHDIIPVLGICLGFQSLCSAFGGLITRLPEPCHGHAKKIHHCGEDIFADVGEVVATNYHSLQVNLFAGDQSATTSGSTSLSSSPGSSNKSLQSLACQELGPGFADFEPFLTCPSLRPLAWDDQGTLMAVKHVELPFWGLQFHPESCRSNAACRKVIKKWWEAATNWSTFTKPVTIISKSLLPSGHVWSRPLTPIPAGAEPGVSEKSCGAKLSFCEHMQSLTAVCSNSVESHTLKLEVNASRIAELCKSLSEDDQAMLESTRKGQYSIYALPGTADWRLEYDLTTLKCTIFGEDRTRTQWRLKLLHVLDAIHRLVAKRRVKGGPQSAPFWGGFIGFLSYEVGLERLDIEQKRQSLSDSVPDISLKWVERSIVIDHLSGEVHVQSIRKDDSAWVRGMVAKLNSLEHPKSSSAPPSERLQALLSAADITLPNEEEYKQNIQACQSYLYSGDSYELCLTTEAQIRLHSHPENSWLLYVNLRHHNPVPFSAFLHLGQTTILSSSPEQFLSWDRTTGTINMIPMKGTVAKSPTMTLSKAAQILASPKESAENLMIADLIRHDLYSTVGWTSSVEVIKLCQVIEHETVFQLVSHIRATPPIPATLSPDEHQAQIIHYGHKALRQTLPPGSMTGAPKKRSCEILARLEQRRRGVYSGVIGYLDVGGGGAFSVCIRTAVSDEAEDRDGSQTWRVGAGGAVTVLSDVDAEWEEMKSKLDSVLRAFRVDR
jgi:para-aminobenzoate synthetase